MKQKGFTLILIVFVISAIVITGAVLYKTGKLSPFLSNIAKIFTESENIIDEDVNEGKIEETKQNVAKIENKVESLNNEADELEKKAEIAKDELEKARLIAEAEKARAEAERARAEAEKAKAEIERLKIEQSDNTANTNKYNKPEQTNTSFSVTEVLPSKIVSNKDANITINGYNFLKGDIFVTLIGVYSDTSLEVGATYVNSNTINFRYPRGLIVPDIYSLRVKNSNGITKTLASTLEIVDASTLSTPQSNIPTNQNKEPNLVSIISQWRPYIAYLECDFVYTNGVKYATQAGSGLLVSGSEVFIFTNRHVVMNDDIYRPKVCFIKIPDYSSVLSVYYDDGVYMISASLDAALIEIKNASNIIKNRTFANNNICEGKPSIGDKIIVLGYPSIGSKTDITATEGIISGYDGDYYITSAKIDHGNSGGAAILLKDNCYLGIPTSVVVGEMESLGRILSMEAISK